jgi:histidyl-tRNA synthetase
MNTNILRIFDSKNEKDQEIMAKAPVLLEHLGDESLEHFEQVKKLLLAAGVQFYVEPALVRGLDYYTHTTFEIISGSVGSQDALCGGGRYDLLVEQLGGESTPGVGFAAGIERILLAAEKENVLQDIDDKIDIYVVTLDKELSQFAYETALFYRERNYKVELDYAGRSVKAQMREANRLKTKVTLMIGGEEFQEGKIIVKYMETGDQEFIQKNQLEKLLDKIEAV